MSNRDYDSKVSDDVVSDVPVKAAVTSSGQSNQSEESEPDSSKGDLKIDGLKYKRMTGFKRWNIPKWVPIAGVTAVVLIIVIGVVISFGAGGRDSSYSTSRNSGGAATSVSAGETSAQEDEDSIVRYLSYFYYFDLGKMLIDADIDAGVQTATYRFPYEFDDTVDMLMSYKRAAIHYCNVEEEKLVDRPNPKLSLKFVSEDKSSAAYLTLEVISTGANGVLQSTVDIEGDGKSIRASERCELPEKSSVKTASDTSTSTPTSAPSSYNNDNVPTLPDPGAFLKCSVRENQKTGDGGWLLSYYFSKDDGEEPAEEFVELLQNCYSLKLANHQYDDWKSTSAQERDSYFFDYTGNSKVNSVKDWEGTYDVHVAIMRYYDRGAILLSFYFSKDFTIADNRERASSFPTDYNGRVKKPSSSAASSDSDSDDFDSSRNSSSDNSAKKITCGLCLGKGRIKCRQCNGDGSISRYVSVPNYSGNSTTTRDASETCNKCGGSGEQECSRCHGSGKQ